MCVACVYVCLCMGMYMLSAFKFTVVTQIFQMLYPYTASNFPLLSL